MSPDIKPSKIVTAVREKIIHLTPDQRTYYTGAALLIATQAADHFSTELAFSLTDLQEINPVMIWLADRFGPHAPNLTKFGGVSLILGGIEVYRRRRGYYKLAILALRVGSITGALIAMNNMCSIYVKTQL